MLTTFLNIEPTDITAMLGYSTDFINNMKPILIPIIAISLGLIIISVLVRLFTKN